MKETDRRSFVKGAAVTGLGIGLLGPVNALALSTLEQTDNGTSKDYPYRGWEDIYRSEYEFDRIGFASHCNNCHGNCAFKILVKDDIVVREEQLAQYPQIVEGIPDTNPRGCQKGAVHSTSMYEADRLQFPMKRAGERGEGKWQRISWDQAAEEIADKIIDIYEEFGPGNLMTQPGTGISSNGKLAAAYRFASLLGGVLEDGMTNVGDLNTGVHLAYGDPLQGFSTDAWFEADYIMMTMYNPMVTRMPDAHYFSEARYRGARVVSIAPDYNPSSIHADLWIRINPATDAFFFLSIAQTIMQEGLWNVDFVKEQTDLPLLVRKDNARLLRQSDLVEDGNEEIFFLWDSIKNTAIEAPGSMGSEQKSLKLNKINPALEGTFQVEGIEVEPAFVAMQSELAKYSPEATHDTTGVHPDIVRKEARLIAKAKKLCLNDGFAVGKVINGIYIGWAQALVCALTARGGSRGGIDSSWADDGSPATFRLAFMDFQKTPRLEAGGLASFLRGEKMKEARNHFDPVKLKQRVGFNLDELQEMIDETVDSQQMPYGGKVKGLISIADNKFNRNKGPQYRARILEQVERLFVDINVRMDSTAMWADYLLPAASHYEGWDIRKVSQHRFVNLFTAPVKPIGEAKPDWDIMVLLTKKIQERARARGVTSYQDGPVSRDFHTIYDDYTMGGKLVTARDEVKWMIENSPETAGQTFEEGVAKGFLTVYTNQWPESSVVTADKTINPWEKQVQDKIPYPTLSGRMTFYCDHERFQKLGSSVPTARLNAGRDASNYPYVFYTPHTRWGIHSNWRANKHMLRLQRGEPFVYINPGLARHKGINDGDEVRIFNGIGQFYAQAKITPNVQDDQVLMEHAWEPYQFKNRQGLNDVVATLLQPLELVGDWGHLKFALFRWNANQLGNESSVDIERATHS